MYSAIGMLLTAAAVTGFIANSAIGRVDDLLQANIEALANGEDAMGSARLDSNINSRRMALRSRRFSDVPKIKKYAR